jgi:hypothetical protein
MHNVVNRRKLQLILSQAVANTVNKLGAATCFVPGCPLSFIPCIPVNFFVLKALFTGMQGTQGIRQKKTINVSHSE